MKSVRPATRSECVNGSVSQSHHLLSVLFMAVLVSLIFLHDARHWLSDSVLTRRRCGEETQLYSNKQQLNHWSKAWDHRSSRMFLDWKRWLVWRIEPEPTQISMHYTLSKQTSQIFTPPSSFTLRSIKETKQSAQFQPKQLHIQSKHSGHHIIYIYIFLLFFFFLNMSF